MHLVQNVCPQSNVRGVWGPSSVNDSQHKLQSIYDDKTVLLSVKHSYVDTLKVKMGMFCSVASYQNNEFCSTGCYLFAGQIVYSDA